MVAKMKTTVPHLPTGIATSNQCKDISHHPARIFVQSQVGKGKGAIEPITFFCHSLVGSHSTTYNCIPISAHAISDVKYRTEKLQQGHIASRNESSAAMYLDDQRWEEQVCARVIT